MLQQSQVQQLTDRPTDQLTDQLLTNWLTNQLTNPCGYEVSVLTHTYPHKPLSPAED